MVTRTAAENSKDYSTGKETGLRRFSWWDTDKTPHWLRYGKGHAGVEFTTHMKNKYLSIYTKEYGERSGKRTMITLQPDDARKLYDWLKTVYEPGEQP